MRTGFLPAIAPRTRRQRAPRHSLVCSRGTLALQMGLLLLFVLLAIGAFAFDRTRGGAAHETSPRRPDRPKPGASLQRLPLVFVLLALTILATACAWRSEASVNAPTEPRPVMNIEVPSPGQVTLPFRIAGWAVDLAARDGTGVDRLEVLEGGCEGTVIGIATNGIDRPDVAETFGPQFAPSGWQFEVKLLRPGDYILAVRAKRFGADNYDQCQAIQVTVR